MVKTYQLTATVWRYPGKASWHFITIPIDISAEINYYFDHAKKGWGSLPVTVTSQKVSWETSIFFDSKTQSFLLPLKVQIRKQLEIVAGTEMSLSLSVEG